jgi:hypothetical protein
MNITNARATFGINAKATPSKAGSKGTIQIGNNNETVLLTEATKIVSFDAVIAGAASDLVIDISDLDNTGSTEWTAGSAQTETATAAGTTTAAGNVSVVVTSPGMTNSPKTIAVAVASGDTAATWAEKVRATLAADVDVSSMWTVGGSSASIVLTRKPTKTYTVNGVSVPLYAANIAANVALANGTPDPGITPAATSTEGAGAAAGVLTVGTYAPDLDGTDFEGVATGSMTDPQCLLIKNASDSSGHLAISQGSLIADYVLQVGGAIMASGGLSTTDDISISAQNNALVTITLAGAD